MHRVIPPWGTLAKMLDSLPREAEDPIFAWLLSSSLSPLFAFLTVCSGGVVCGGADVDGVGGGFGCLVTAEIMWESDGDCVVWWSDSTTTQPLLPKL